MMSSEDFRAKVVAVTGGGQGIGLCLVSTFAQRGAKVAFCDINVKNGRHWERRFTEAGLEVIFVPADLANVADTRKFAEHTLHEYNRVDVLINNAGITDFGQRFSQRPLKEWTQRISVNLTSYWLCAQLFAPELIKSKGCIINIASTRALMSEPDTEPYSASKGGIVALTHSLAITLGHRGVRVNCVSPGWIDTSAWRLGPSKPKLRRIDHLQHPVGRVGRPEDIAEACLFLASSRSAGFITGQNFVVDGGMTRKMIYES